MLHYVFLVEYTSNTRPSIQYTYLIHRNLPKGTVNTCGNLSFTKFYLKVGNLHKVTILSTINFSGESWVKEEVAASTGLPPQVEGQLRCYLKLSVNQVLWMVPSSPEDTHVRVRWWGEPGDGTVFR